MALQRRCGSRTAAQDRRLRPPDANQRPGGMADDAGHPRIHPAPDRQAHLAHKPRLAYYEPARPPEHSPRIDWNFASRLLTGRGLKSISMRFRLISQQEGCDDEGIANCA